MTTHTSSANATDPAASLQDKAVVITGGTTGIGRATALQLASLGAKVLICGRHEQEMDDALADLRDQSSDVSGVIADMAEPEDVRKLFREADNQLGRVDILINNAALAAKSVADSEISDYGYIVRANVLGYMQCCEEAYDRMKANGGGHIVNVGSMSAVARKGGSDIYVATKAAMQGFSESFRKKVNEDGIKVTLIEPGSVGTDMQDSSPAEQREKQAELKSLKAEDIAACIYYCLTQPARCDVVSVQIRPHKQLI